MGFPLSRHLQGCGTDQLAAPRVASRSVRQWGERERRTIENWKRRSRLCVPLTGREAGWLDRGREDRPAIRHLSIDSSEKKDNEKTKEHNDHGHHITAGGVR